MDKDGEDWHELQMTMRKPWQSYLKDGTQFYGCYHAHCVDFSWRMKMSLGAREQNTRHIIGYF